MTKVYVKRPAEVYPVGDLWRLMDAFPDSDPISRRNRAIVAVLISTGMKPVEICGLCVKDYDREQGALFTRLKGPKLLPRVTPLLPRAEDILNSYFSARSEIPSSLFSDALFLSRNLSGRMHRKSICHLLREASQRISFPSIVTPTTIRVSVGTALFKSGTSLDGIMDLLGYSNLNRGGRTMLRSHFKREFAK